jgi:hypothetical protein
LIEVTHQRALRQARLSGQFKRDFARLIVFCILLGQHRVLLVNLSGVNLAPSKGRFTRRLGELTAAQPQPV